MTVQQYSIKTILGQYKGAYPVSFEFLTLEEIFKRKV